MLIDMDPEKYLETRLEGFKVWVENHKLGSKECEDFLNRAALDYKLMKSRVINLILGKDWNDFNEKDQQYLIGIIDIFKELFDHYKYLFDDCLNAMLLDDIAKVAEFVNSSAALKRKYFVTEVWGYSGGHGGGSGRNGGSNE